MTRIKLGVNNCFAIKRWPEPEEWCRIVREIFGIKYVQFSFDMLDPTINSIARYKLCKKIRDSAEKYDLTIHSTFTGLGFYSFNQLLHPDPGVRRDAVHWCEEAIYTTSAIGAKGTGGPLGSFSVKDFRNKERRETLTNVLVEYLQYFAELADNEGQEFFLWEPTPIAREICHTIEEARQFYSRVNKGSSIPILYCLDTGHQCATDTEGIDKDTYAWLREFSAFSPVIHIQQTSGKLDNHWPFTREFNKKGIIEPKKVIESIKKSGAKEVILLLEINHPFEADDNKVLKDWVESVKYWKDSGLV